jgi:hypothetical protein
MSPDEIHHFLVSRDPDSGVTTVEEFGTDYGAALQAYADAERANGINPRMNTVLLSADSLRTIEKTHSSYFGDADPDLKQLLKL